LRSFVAFFLFLITLGFSKKRRRRTSDNTRSVWTFFLKRFKALSKDSPSLITIRDTCFPPLLVDL